MRGPLPPILTKIAATPGGVQALADALGVSRQAIYAWRKRIPAERVADVERITGIPRETLRPDLYEAAQ